MDKEKAEIHNPSTNAMTLIMQLEGKVREKNSIIKGLEEQSTMWRTKFIMSTMLNWANPIPLVSGTVFGGTFGWWITWLVMRHK